MGRFLTVVGSSWGLLYISPNDSLFFYFFFLHFPVCVLAAMESCWQIFPAPGLGWSIVLRWWLWRPQRAWGFLSGMESRAGARSNRLFPHPFLFLPGRHSVIRPALDVGLEPVQLTPRTSSWPCTHIFEQLISTFGSDSGRVASRGTRAITCSVNGSVTFSHYICSLSGYGSGRAKPHALYFHADIDSRELERASSLCSAQ